MITPEGKYAFNGRGFDRSAGQAKDTYVTIAGNLIFDSTNVLGAACVSGINGTISGKWRSEPNYILVTFGISGIDSNFEWECFFDDTGFFGSFIRRSKDKLLEGSLMRAG